MSRLAVSKPMDRLIQLYIHITIMIGPADLLIELLLVYLPWSCSLALDSPHFAFNLPSHVNSRDNSNLPSPNRPLPGFVRLACQDCTGIPPGSSKVPSGSPCCRSGAKPFLNIHYVADCLLLVLIWRACLVR